MSQDINAKIQASRKELLDIGLRNNLISFKKTSKTLALKVEDLLATFEALYVHDKVLTFEAAKESPSSRNQPRAAVRRGARRALPSCKASTFRRKTGNYGVTR